MALFADFEFTNKRIFKIAFWTILGAACMGLIVFEGSGSSNSLLDNIIEGAILGGFFSCVISTCYIYHNQDEDAPIMLNAPDQTVEPQETRATIRPELELSGLTIAADSQIRNDHDYPNPLTPSAPPLLLSGNTRPEVTDSIKTSVVAPLLPLENSDGRRLDSAETKQRITCL